MTPLWREVIKPLLSGNHKYPPTRLGILAKARCFDLRDVQRLIYDTSTEMRRGSSYRRVSDGHYFSTDIGERVCLPAPICWLEWNDCAVLIDQESTGTALLAAWVKYTEHPSGLKILVQDGRLLGGLTLEDGMATVYRADSKESELGDLSPDEDGVQISFMALATLALINSPAATRSPIEPHRGFERWLRRGAPQFDSAIKHTRVTLALSAAEQANAGCEVQSSHPKAFHFCRAHTRQRSNGKVERVRAHWRGDPAFGVRLPSYKVAA